MRLATFALSIAITLMVAVLPAAAQTFVFGAQGEPVQLDPAVITDGISSRITRQVFDGLVRYKGATTEVEPALAEKWDVSRDGRVWTFQLRRAVKARGRNTSVHGRSIRTVPAWPCEAGRARINRARTLSPRRAVERKGGAAAWDDAMSSFGTRQSAASRTCN